MSIKLRDYQVRALDAIRGKFEKFSSCLLVVATGGGKTVMAWSAVKDHLRLSPVARASGS